MLVFTPRAFPGMSESTFLSRSFGDQGVKLRIRKEPRVLGYILRRSSLNDCSNGSVVKGQRPRIFCRQTPRMGTPSRHPLNIEIWGCSRNMNKVEASVLRDTESQYLVTTIRLSSGKECLLIWLEGLHMTMINGFLNALTYSSGILSVNMPHQHLVVDHITFKVLQPVLVTLNTLLATDVQIHLPTLRLSCLHERNIQRTNFQRPIQCISRIPETLLISTRRVSIPLPKRDRSHSWHNLYPLTVRCLRLFRLTQSNPEHTHDQWRRTSSQWRVEGTSKATTMLSILP